MINLLKLLLLKLKYYKKNTVVKSSKVSIRAVIGTSCLIENGVFVSSDSVIGNFSYVNANSSLENTTIGNFCSISSGVIIGPYEHKYNYISTHPFYKQKFYGFDNLVIDDNENQIANKCTIGNDVWIGVNSIIKSGIQIGDGAIVASGSVVTKNIPEYEIWGGVPARFIKFRFQDSVINDLKIINWPNKDIKWIQKYIIPNIFIDLKELCKVLLSHLND